MKNKLFLLIISAAICNNAFAQTDIPHIWYGDTILYVMPENSANYVEWGGYGEDITVGNAAANEMNGQLNTSSIVEQLGDNNGVPYAARFCDTLTAFGYSDWYLPARYELFVMCLKKDSLGNNFIVRESDFYWMSTQALGMLPNQAGRLTFGNCEGGSDNKNELHNCRCIRREYPSTIKAEQNSGDILFFQDKSSKIINIEVPDKNEELKIMVYDVSGKLILSELLNNSLTENTKTISYSGFEGGAYILKLSGKSFEKSYKFIVE